MSRSVEPPSNRAHGGPAQQSKHLALEKDQKMKSREVHQVMNNHRQNLINHEQMHKEKLKQ